jgi:signal transduction histidine kinase/ActR/RegA family two-component response regulator
MEARVSAFAERDQRGRIRQILAVVLDVTEQERLEDYLRQMQKLEALGTLAGGIAHDFNNILFAILGYADMALEGVAEESPARSDLEEIVAAGERAKGLVSQIISFARGGDGSRAPMDPAPIVKEGLKLMRATLPQNVRLQASIDGPGAPILANPTSLHQILMNLCRNATQAVAETGGEVRVRLERTALEADAPSNPPGLAAGPYARLAVTDDGPGISPAAQERIFDPFYTTREPGSGSGMGLAVVHGIVSDLGGAVTLDSRQGGGTTVTVLLPLDVEAEAGDETAETAPHASGVVAGRLRILVVDDEPSLVAMLLGMLESLGHEARGHSDPHEALAEFERAPDAVDLVITDQTMPDMTGEELAQALFARRADLPVIVCTGFSESLSPERAEELGVAGFLMKPFTMKELKRRVAKAAPRDQIPAETIEQGGPPS